MLLSSNGRTPVFQTDVDAGSIPVKSTKYGMCCHKGSVKPLSVNKIVTGLEFRGSIPSYPTKYGPFV